ncbi:hypothetical protein JJV70_00710 [Streptomyces sp. JJ66]|uniref:hypothetical protein n=1 Tax=Streptomyces sp. JJ66 TaxID=2803843 RepID=UPI001C591D26|nr:hypothetical protein [Streptomyces sp. JJ66]MBW1600649.1 hypothetical protein [Streptomyces sp. JJ66]
MSTEPLLIVADHVAGRVTVLTVPGGTQVAALEGRHVSEHAGFLALPGGRIACVDDLRGELLVLDPGAARAGRPLLTATAPVAVPAEHLAADTGAEHVVVTTGLGAHEEPWSELVTAVELNTGRAVRSRIRAGEPGVTLAGPGAGALALLRHRAPGELAAFPLASLLDAGPGCPHRIPAARAPLPDDGHGDAYDPVTGRVFAATGAGVHRVRVTGGALAPEPPLPWRCAGRGYFLRVDARRRLLWSCVRGGPDAPSRWPEWSNTAWCHALDTGRTEHVELGPGLVFRMALARHAVAFTRIHPDGDELVLVDTTGERPAVTARRPLPPMAGAPRRGGTPWDSVQRRAVAASPGADWVAVSRGGHGEVALFDARAGEQRALLRTGTPLDEGGRLAMVRPGDGASGDTVGR